MFYGILFTNNVALIEQNCIVGHITNCRFVFVNEKIKESNDIKLCNRGPTWTQTQTSALLCVRKQCRISDNRVSIFYSFLDDMQAFGWIRIAHYQDLFAVPFQFPKMSDTNRRNEPCML